MVKGEVSVPVSGRGGLTIIALFFFFLVRRPRRGFAADRRRRVAGVKTRFVPSPSEQASEHRRATMSKRGGKEGTADKLGREEADPSTPLARESSEPLQMAILALFGRSVSGSWYGRKEEPSARS